MRGLVSCPPEDPWHALVGFGSSFGGKYFGGFARSSRRVYIQESARGLNTKMRALRVHGAAFFCADFIESDLCPRYDDCLVYLDPPYAGTTRYQGAEIDHARFWARARAVSRFTDVFVSEYAAPAGWEEVWSAPASLSVGGRNRRHARTERLFYRGPH